MSTSTSTSQGLVREVELMKHIIPILLVLAMCVTGIVTFADESGYTQIDQDRAKEMMTREDGHIVVDVRRQDEYDAGHIPGAILIPNESIGTEQPEELPDLNQIILIYCRSGNRSKQASEKLAAMGYTAIYEFGGINTWTGEIVTKEDELQSHEITVKVTDGSHTIIYQLNDSLSARSLYDMLPIETEVEDYGSNEKIFYPEKEIDTAEGIEGGGEAGGLALFSPWGNVVMFYDSFDAYPGLFILGEAIEGVDRVKNLAGTIRVEKVE